MSNTALCLTALLLLTLLGIQFIVHRLLCIMCFGFLLFLYLYQQQFR